MSSPRDEVYFQERRQGPASALVVMVQQIHENVSSLDTKLTTGLAEQKADLQSVLVQAFPEGDADGHRRHHEAVIKAAEDKAKFWNTMRTELAKWGLLGFMGWAIVALWQTFLQGPHK
ncbi:hypothetical protein UFOVP61_38 [uncultured Caudovirales phage]|uniref:Uncharacterized protein n=1 Tax=uncultured Caudovirales phage TaxID=2100421 RepID=A0A6J5KX66_9CAUD|nr:hypothetical protein UFOVP61_38 [uncultured Caudovirales phage]